jgi:glycine/D-amino acid oxidase-like deaminating enzyme
LSFTNWAIDDLLGIMKTESLSRDSGLVQSGALQLYYDNDALETARKNKGWSVNADLENTAILSREEVLALEPCLAHISEDSAGGHGSDQLVGGALQTSAASASCLGYTTGLLKVLQTRHKDRFHVESNISVVDFETEYGTITQVHTSRGTLDVPVGVEVVVTAGSWTPLILRKLDLYCPVYPMKGADAFTLNLLYSVCSLLPAEYRASVIIVVIFIVMIFIVIIIIIT